MKRGKEQKTKAKSRTNHRPALLQTGVSMMHCVRTVLNPLVYLLSVLVLFQFMAVRIVLGFYEGPNTLSPLPQNPAQIYRIVQAAEQPTTSQAPAQVRAGLPSRLKIPGLKVNTVIQPVGLMPNGSMGVPKLPRDAAWYKFGPKPGERGSAVIAGHINWWNGAKGVFQQLGKVKVGDKITVQDDQGNHTDFVVRKIREFGQKDDASEVFYSYDGNAHLNLITCSGFWDKAAQVYTKRLVVFADKVVK